MASIKKGTITAPRQWWKHLKEFKRDFWKRERKAHKFATNTEVQEAHDRAIKKFPEMFKRLAG